MSSSFKKVLIINTFGIGDVLFTTPLIRSLKAHDPHISIGFVCNARTQSIIERNSDIDRVFVYERDEYDALYKKSKLAFARKTVDLIAQIKKEQYGHVIDVSMQSMVNFLTLLIGIPVRIGFNYRNRSPFLTKKITFNGYESKHVAEYYMDLVKEIGVEPKAGGLRLDLDQKDMDWAQGFLKESGISGEKLVIGLVPGGGASWGRDALYKRWPAENYAKLADKIIEKFKAEIILMGDEKELDLCANVADLMKNRPHMACAKTTISQFGALAQKCSLVIVNDGGPLHIAVASKTRTLSVFGPVDEHVYGPYPKENHIVVTNPVACRPCYRQFRRASCEHISCLAGLAVDEVLRAIDL